MKNTIIDGPRVMLAGEYDELLELIEVSYGFTRTYYLNHFPKARKENIIFENHFIIKERGRLVSHVGLYPMQAVACESNIKVGGIGDVATHPAYQGKGYMSKLLEYSISEMRERDIPISILGGDTQRYRHFGWETAGREIIFSLNRRSVSNIKNKEMEGFLLREYNQKNDLDKIINTHETEPIRIKRSRKTYQELLKNTGIQTWIGEKDNHYCYAVLGRGGKVIEFGGHLSMVIKLFTFLLNNYSINNLNVHLPYMDSGMLRTLYEISSSWKIFTLYMIKINDLKKTIFSFREQIKSKAELHGIKKGNSVNLGIRNSNEEIGLCMQEGMEIINKKAGEIIFLSDIEMVRLLFGPSAVKLGKNKEQKSLLSLLFPLDFYIWGLDHV